MDLPWYMDPQGVTLPRGWVVVVLSSWLMFPEYMKIYQNGSNLFPCWLVQTNIPMIS